jgi:hypothetical protein
MIKMATILARARALMDTPEKWTKSTDGRFGRNGRAYNSGGNTRDLKKATCLCSYGAIRAAVDYDAKAPVKGRNRVACRRQALAKEFVEANGVPFGGLISFNDNESTSHADVMAVFDKAIAAAKARDYRVA